MENQVFLWENGSLCVRRMTPGETRLFSPCPPYRLPNTPSCPSGFYSCCLYTGLSDTLGVIRRQDMFLAQTPKFGQSPQRISLLVLPLISPPRDQAFWAFPDLSADPQIIEVTCYSTIFRSLAFSLAHPQGCNLPER